MSELSNKELKELKKKEKAAKRAAQKEAAGVSPEQQQQLAQKADKRKAKKEPAPAPKTASLFSHLETLAQRRAAPVPRSVHPAVLTLALHIASHRLVGTARLRAMMAAFKCVIADYETPERASLSRHLTTHLGVQIEHLKSLRPLLVLMGNAIRWLKQEISHVLLDEHEHEAKAALCLRIDDFVRDKVDLSGRLIVENAAHHIAEGSTVLTFGHLAVLERLLLHCAQSRTFSLIVVDLRPLFEGRQLVRLGVRTSYVLVNLLLATLLDTVDCVLLGAHAMLSNGHLYARVGTAMVAMACHRRNIPVLVCCELIKFTDRVQLDLVTTNELGNPDLERARKRLPALEKLAPQPEDGPNVLNIMYDLTPPHYINKVITELGALPPLLVPVILREYKNV